MSSSRSPWRRVLAERIDELDPSLTDYFGAVPAGHVGRGAGIFSVVGTPRHWLWPLLWLLSLDGIVFPVWQRAVPFDIVNVPTAEGTVRSERTFHFSSGDRTMFDEIGVTSRGLTDRLGRRGMLAANLDASVVKGTLVLRSTGITLRLGSVRFPLGFPSPRVTLVERRAGGRQRVSLILHAPVLGRLYEFDGEFDYRIERTGD